MLFCELTNSNGFELTRTLFVANPLDTAKAVNTSVNGPPNANGFDASGVSVPSEPISKISMYPGDSPNPENSEKIDGLPKEGPKSTPEIPQYAHESDGPSNGEPLTGVSVPAF